MFPTLQFIVEVMMNSGKPGSFSRSSTGSSSTDDTFRPYESRRDDAVTLLNMNVEAMPNWRIKNTVADCIFQDDQHSLKRTISEIKNTASPPSVPMKAAWVTPSPFSTWMSSPCPTGP